VTRRGNVHDNVERRTVFATHGMGSIKERLVIAQTWIAQQPDCLHCQQLLGRHHCMLAAVARVRSFAGSLMADEDSDALVKTLIAIDEEGRVWARRLAIL
jgi:hypothetical protein